MSTAVDQNLLQYDAYISSEAAGFRLLNTLMHKMWLCHVLFKVTINFSLSRGDYTYKLLETMYWENSGHEKFCWPWVRSTCPQHDMTCQPCFFAKVQSILLQPVPAEIYLETQDTKSECSVSLTCSKTREAGGSALETFSQWKHSVFRHS